MLRPALDPIHYSLETLKIYIGHAEDLQKRSPTGSTSANDAEKLINNSIETLERLVTFCNSLECAEATKYIKDVIDTLRRPVYRNLTRLSHELMGVMRIVQGEAGARWLYYIKKQKYDLRVAETKLWSPVMVKFRSADDDITSALMCYAVDENTACIFHLMRIAELGLRALAKERRVKIPRKPLEWADWQEILTHLGQKVEAIAKRKRGPTKDAALLFYQGCLGEFGAFKDTYRNMAMHVRKRYDEHEAASALLHVREFMVRLSARLGESDTKTIKWGKF